MGPTKTNLLLAAEELIGIQGLSSVSMRQIRERSGNRNVAAAQYHFGSMDRLLQALIAFRKATLDTLRERFYREMNMDFGHMVARDYVGPAIQASANGRLVALYDPDPTTRHRAKQLFGVSCHDQLDNF